MILRRITSAGQRRQSHTHELMVITGSTQETGSHTQQWDSAEMMKDYSNKFKRWKTQKESRNRLKGPHRASPLHVCVYVWFLNVSANQQLQHTLTFRTVTAGYVEPNWRYCKTHTVCVLIHHDIQFIKNTEGTLGEFDFIIHYNNDNNNV